MTAFDDGYPAYYAERLWALLPGVYRTTDTDSFSAPGPLRELVDRIGLQMAIVRRSIDRLWADQSIETCDDWVIPYIGDLLGTNLVNALDPRGQRLDVANTIHYRRRKGTVEVLEELAQDVTGWIAHVVEGYRLLGRTRHGLDPGVGPAAYPGTDAGAIGPLLAAEGLIGPLSATPAGGYLNLRDPHGAMLVDTPFDEAFHHLDVRRGTGAVGHCGIEKLLVFLWRLTSFTVVEATPVAVPDCDSLAYAFDPTGRSVALFLPAPPVPDDFAGTWTSALEWQVPGPLSTLLDDLMASQGAASAWSVDGAAVAAVYPELGRFSTAAAPARALTVTYSYGFSTTIGAGPYDRDLLGDPPVQVAPVTPAVTGGDGLDAALTAAPPSATVVIGDSRTYTVIADVGSSAAPIAALLLQAGPQQRPVIRAAPGGGPWVFTGGPGAELVLDGLLVSGCDVVLRGAFASVRLTACTIDPGTAATAPGAPDAPFASAVDGVALGPSRIFVEADPTAPAGTAGAIESLSIDHCVLGPIRTRYDGAVERLTISDSIIQTIPTSAAAAYGDGDVYDPVLLATGLLASGDPLAGALRAALPAAAVSALQTLCAASPSAARAPIDPAILGGLNALVASATPLYDPSSYPAIALRPELLALSADGAALGAADVARLNRGLLDAAFPVALGLAALAVADATVALRRVSVLGPAAVHRLAADDSILTGFIAVDDLQDGCLRFSAISAGSSVPRQYRCAQIAGGDGLFTSDAFGAPGYGQLLDSADAAVTGGSAGASLLTGAHAGAQMGAYSSDMDAVNEQAMLAKFAEYMPLGLTPVVVHVT